MWTTEYNIVEVPFDKGHLNPGRRVETPKDNGKMHLLGTPTVVDRLVQQAINQVLTPIYEKRSPIGASVSVQGRAVTTPCGERKG